MANPAPESAGVGPASGNSISSGRRGLRGIRWVTPAVFLALLLGTNDPALAIRAVPRPETAQDSLTFAAQLLYDLTPVRAGDMARAAIRSLGAREKPDSIEILRGIDIFVGAWLASGRPFDPELEWYAKHAVNERQRLQGDAGLASSPSLHNLADVRHLQGKMEAAQDLHERALDLRKKRFGEAHLMTAESLSRLANFLWSATLAGKIEADPDIGGFILGGLVSLAFDALATEIGADSENFQDYLTASIFDEGQEDKLLSASKPLRQGEELAEKALKIREAKASSGDAVIAESLEDVAKMAREMGDLDEARTYLERARSIYSAILGPESPRALRCDVSLGEIALGGLAYPQGRDLLASVLRSLEDSAVADSSLFARAQMGLGRAYEGLRDSSGARLAYERVDDYLGAWRESYVYAVRAELALGRLCQRRGDLRGAQARFNKARDVAALHLGKHHPMLGVAHMHLGALERERGDYGNAGKSFSRALEILEDAFGSRHALVAECLYQNALTYSDRGEWRKALRAFDQTLGWAHPATALARQDQAYFYAKTGKGTYEGEDDSGNKVEYDDTWDTAMVGWRAWRQHLVRTIQYLPEPEALQIADTPARGLDIAVRHAERMDGKRLMQTWDEVIRSRGLVIDEMAERHRQASRSDDSTTAALRMEVLSGRRRLATLLVRGVDSQSNQRYAAAIANATADVNRAEQRLYEHSATFRRQAAHRDAGVKEVLGALPKGSAMISYRRYLHVEQDATDKEDYIAFVAWKGKVHAFQLGHAYTIDPLVAQWREEAGRGALRKDQGPAAQEAACRKVGEELRKRIWDPLAKKLKDAQQVYIVPDGALYLANFAALPVGTSSYLGEAGPLIHYLDAERDLVLDGSASGPGDRYVLIGGPDFEASRPDGPAVASLDGASTGTAPAASYRGLRASCGEFEQVRFSPLPGATEEVHGIARRIEGSAGFDSTKSSAPVVLLGADATTEAFERLGPGSTTLHLATHGFFLSGTCAPQGGTTRAIGAIEVEGAPSAEQNVGNHPLRLSGLALAGANHRSDAPIGADDGILTAEEIAALDLSSARWVVLSACDTGVGDVRAGEGVFGLRRAFQIAGARTIIMSLWPVDDQSTREWMERLYEARASGRRNTAESVREAGSAMLRERRARGESTHPFYWASFIAAGDPR